MMTREQEDSRDPFGINTDVEVVFEDVIAEPKATRSPEFSWKVNYYCFNGPKKFCYGFLAIFFGPIFALMFGCVFACVTFLHIWFLMPVFRITKIIFGIIKNVVGLLVNTVVIPCCYGFGHIYSVGRVKYVEDNQKDEKKTGNEVLVA